MNLPWWLIGVAFALAVYGALRALDMSALAALVGTFSWSSLPILNVHVALAGYADLPMAAYYAAHACVPALGAHRIVATPHWS